MLTIERTTGHAYAADKDYDALRGRVVAKRVTKLGITQDGYVIGRVTRLIDIGRGDPVAPCDPDATIADEGTDEDGNPRRRMGMQAKTESALAQVRELLQDKPLNTRELATALGMTMSRVKALLLNHPEDFVILGKVREGHIYALKGHEYTSRVLLKSMPRMAEYVRRHGPSSFSEMSRALGMTYKTLHESIDANPGVMALVGRKHISRGMVDLWGLVGIHDQQEAA